MTHFCNEKSHLSTHITEIIRTLHAILLHPCWGSVNKQLYAILGAFYKGFPVQKEALWHEQHRCVWCCSLEGTEMQQVDCFNLWELNASSTLPAALLHPSDEQQVGWCNARVLTASSTSSKGLPDHCSKPLKAKSNEKCTHLGPPQIFESIAN
jgi:hypothetical protein